MATAKKFGVMTLACILVGCWQVLLPSKCQAVTLDGWIVAPQPWQIFYGQAGPDGILGTADDLPAGGIGVDSGYKGGLYIKAQGQLVTADVEMRSQAWPIPGNLWHYVATVWNRGTGDFVEWRESRWKDPQIGQVYPNFLQNPPLKPGQFETDWVNAPGPPVRGWWGGRWNPEVGLEVQYLLPIPEPASLLLFGTGLRRCSVSRGGVAGRREVTASRKPLPDR